MLVPTWSRFRQWWQNFELSDREAFDLAIGSLLILLMLFIFGAKAQQGRDNAENEKAFEEIFSKKPLG